MTAVEKKIQNWWGDISLMRVTEKLLLTIIYAYGRQTYAGYPISKTEILNERQLDVKQINVTKPNSVC